ncbi:hypothetical protein, partial [Staphylococcus hominis]|uniref:hypothetical protein n=1 Tax=Staphylococcus hominis TaxID=1290 RepID=UPI001C92E90A
RHPPTQLTIPTFHTPPLPPTHITQPLPPIQHIFQPPNPKPQPLITQIQPLVQDIKLPKHPQQQILIKPPNQTPSYLPSPTSTIKVQIPQSLQRRQVLTQPSIEP